MQEAEAKMLYLIWENVKICILSIHFIPSAGPRMVTEFASIDGRDLFGFQHLWWLWFSDPLSLISLQLPNGL